MLDLEYIWTSDKDLEINTETDSLFISRKSNHWTRASLRVFSSWAGVTPCGIMKVYTLTNRRILCCPSCRSRYQDVRLISLDQSRKEFLELFSIRWNI